jgi:polyhydroxyalkanoate synthesis repressor PhaR
MHNEFGAVMVPSKRVIKKYPNRRLYDTDKSAYITLTEVKDLVIGNVPFEVLDAKTNDEITRSILLQIILEEESGGEPIFTTEMLAHMIRCYGNAMQGVMGTFLERGIHSFIDVQHKLQDQAKALYGNAAGLSPDIWAQFFQAQGPIMQGMMGNYLEQSANMFLDMQTQMQKQARGIFSNLAPFVPKPETTGTEPAPAPEPDPESEPAPSAKSRRSTTK